MSKKSSYTEISEKNVTIPISEMRQHIDNMPDHIFQEFLKQSMRRKQFDLVEHLLLELPHRIRPDMMFRVLNQMNWRHRGPMITFVLDKFHTQLQPLELCKLLDHALVEDVYGPAKYITEHLSDRLMLPDLMKSMKLSLAKPSREPHFKSLLEKLAPRLEQTHFDAILAYCVQQKKTETIDYLLQFYKEKFSPEELHQSAQTAHRHRNRILQNILSQGSYHARIAEALADIKHCIAETTHPDFSTDKNSHRKINANQSLENIHDFLKTATLDQKITIFEAIKSKEPSKLLLEIQKIMELQSEFQVKFRIGEEKKYLPREIRAMIFQQAHPLIMDIPYGIAKDLLKIKRYENILKSTEPSSLRQKESRLSKAEGTILWKN